MMRLFLFLFLLSVGIPGILLGQGVGGGAYLEDNASCEGCLVRNNQAQSGYGVGGGDATLLNATVVNNQKLKADTVGSVLPGDIYCADGAIVDTLKYKNEGRTDAVGVVYWVRRDLDDPYPAGAVVALEESTGSWGKSDAFEMQHLWDYYDYSGFFMLDTACYQNTKLLYDKALTIPGGTEIYKATCYCHEFQAEQQSLSLPLQWALPTYVFLRRLLAASPLVEQTLAFLQREQPALTLSAIGHGKTQANAWYWSCDDTTYKYSALCINFVSGETAPATGAGAEPSQKSQIHCIRPILLY